MSEPNAPRLLIYAFAIENLCAQVLFIYIPLFVIFREGDGMLGSFVRALAYVGPVLFGYYIGWVVDRFEKRRLGCMIALLMGSAAAAYTLRLPNQTLVETCLFLGVVSIGTYFLNNLRASALPCVAPPAQLARLNATLLVAESIALLAAPLIASLLLSTDIPTLGFAGAAILFSLSGAFYYRALGNLPAPKQKLAVTGTFRENIRILTSNKRLLSLVFVVMGNNAFIGVYLLYILVHAVDTGFFDATSAPRILVACAVGSILSGSTADKAITLLGNRRLALLCCSLMAVAGAMPLLVPCREVFFLSALLVGLFAAYVVIAVWTLRQTLIPAETLGRATGITSALFKLSMVIAIPIAGMLGEYLSSAAALLFAITCIFVGVTPLAQATIIDHLNKAQRE